MKQERESERQKYIEQQETEHKLLQQKRADFEGVKKDL
jgi:hypothetical protein